MMRTLARLTVRVPAVVIAVVAALAMSAACVKTNLLGPEDGGADVAPDPCRRATGPELMPFWVYQDAGSHLNHFVASGYFGDFNDISIDLAHSTQPRSGSTAMRVDYHPMGQARFAGIFWQCPANNWGTVSGAGFDLSHAQRVLFSARAAAPGTRVEFAVGGIGWDPSAPFPDSLPSTRTVPIETELDETWQELQIDFANAGRADRRHVIGGFMIVISGARNPAGARVYIDDVRWE